MLVRLASPLLLLVSALDPSNHSRPRRTVPADCALPTYPAFVHAAPIHTATFTRFLWDCPISLLRRKAHIRAYTPVTPRVASLSARRNDKRANIRTQMPLFASLCAHGRRFGAHLGTQTSGFVLVHWRFHAWRASYHRMASPPPFTHHRQCTRNMSQPSHNIIKRHHTKRVRNTTFSVSRGWSQPSQTSICISRGCFSSILPILMAIFRPSYFVYWQTATPRNVD